MLLDLSIFVPSLRVLALRSLTRRFGLRRAVDEDVEERVAVPPVLKVGAEVEAACAPHQYALSTRAGTMPSSSSAGSATIAGLPFTILNASVGVPGGTFSETNGGENLSMIGNPNTTNMYVLRCDNSGVAVLTLSNISCLINII